MEQRDSQGKGYKWGGYEPGGDLFVPPESLPESPEGVHWTTKKAPPVWADLTFPASLRTMKGFAMTWVKEEAAPREDHLVQVQWVEHSMAREVWVNAIVVTRRQLADRKRHRDG